MKQRIVGVIAFIAYWCGLDALFYWLNRKAKRILTFHNVIPDELFDPRGNGVSNRESDFRRIIKEAGRRFGFSTDLKDAGTVTITFDDGYLNQYEVAGRVLGEMGIPAIIFPAGDLIGALPEQALVVDQLVYWCEYAPSEVLKREFPVEGAHKRGEYWVKAVRPAYCQDVEAKGRNLLARLDKVYPMAEILAQLSPECRRLRLGGVSQSQLDELRARGWVVGWHTKTHFPLASLSDDEIRRELDSPPEFRNCVLSYPYGELQSVDARALKIAEELGYPCAVSNLSARNDLTGRYFIPRMALPASKYRLHFRLSGMEQFIKCRKLLERVKV